MRKACKRGIRKHLSLKVMRRILRGQFAGVHVRSGNLTTTESDNGSTLYFANHVSAWDGALAKFLTYYWLGQDPFVMTAEPMFPLAEWTGAFSVNPFDSFEVAKSIRYATELLRSVPDCGLWIFPQGIATPYDQRPLGFKPGIGLLVRQIKAQVLVPVIFHYTFGSNSYPEVFVNFGQPCTIVANSNTDGLIADLERRTTNDLDQLNSDLHNGRLEEFETIILRKPHQPLKSWERWRHKVCQRDR